MSDNRLITIENMGKIKIQFATIEDLPEILRLQKKAFLTEAESHGNYDIEPLKQTYESILLDFREHSFLKATDSSNIIGSIKYRKNGDTVWLGKLIVDQDYRGQGLGRRLLTEVEKLNPGITKFQLFTAASSIWNIRLYESVGYMVCGEYSDSGQSGLVMVEMMKVKTKQ